MKSGFFVFFRLLKRTFFNTRNTQARLTPKRLLIMLVFLPVFFVVQVIHWIGFLLDDLFFRGYRKVQIKEPVFIVGVPRSGTTFLHNVLSKDTERYTTFRLWELLLAPSVTQRMFWITLGKLDRLIGGPIAKLIGWIERIAFRNLESIHRISLSSPEEDYFVLVPIFACLILILPFPFPDELLHLAYLDDRTPEADRKRIMAFYRRALQRHLYVHGPDKQLLSKNAGFGGTIESLKETFPDCKLICTMRSPLVTVPSLISSMMSGAQLFANDPQGDTFRDQLVEMMRYFYEHLIARLPEWPENRHVFVTLDELRRDLKGSVERIYTRLGFTISPEFAQRLAADHERARKYSSGHKYSLGQYGLDAERIRRDFAVAFERFAFDVDSI